MSELIPDWWEDPDHLERTAAAAAVIERANHWRRVCAIIRATAPTFDEVAAGLVRLGRMLRRKMPPLWMEPDYAPFFALVDDLEEVGHFMDHTRLLRRAGRDAAQAGERLKGTLELLFA